MKWLLAAVPLVLASCFSNRDDCGVECVSDMSVNAHVAMPETALSGATLTFCQNTACGSVVLPDIAAGSDSQSVTTGALSAYVDIGDYDDTGAVDPTTSWVYVDFEDGTYTDGDSYTLTVTDPSGATLYTNTIFIGTYEIESSCDMTCSDARITLDN